MLGTKLVWRACCAALALAATSPLLAQTALDRTEPPQEQDESNIRGSDDAADTPEVVVSNDGNDSGINGADGRHLISSIMISGNEALPLSAFVDLIEQYTTQPLSNADLARLADDIAQRARSEGYVFATAQIPAQSLAFGNLRVELDEGKVDEIRLEGADDRAIYRQLAPLMSGRPVTRGELERRILLADDISGVRILDSRFEKEGDAGILIVRTRRSNASAYVQFRNNGSEPVGPVRARIRADFNGILASADEIDLTVETTPFQPNELQFARGSYKIVVDASGLELGAHLSYSATEPGAFLADREIDGQFWNAGVNVSYPLLRRRDMSVWVIGEFEVTDLRQDRAGERVRHDRVPAMRAGIYSRGRVAGGNYRGRVMVSRGLDIFSATQLGDIFASRSDASASFTSLYGWLAWDRQVAQNVSVAIGARGQLSADPLLTTEDLGLGGTSFLRGYNFSERSGDQGIMGFGELRYNLRGQGFWLPRAQVYAFADGGVVSNLEDGRGGGSLASAGGGLRLDLTRDLDLDLEVAVPLTGERFDSDSKAPLLNLRIGQSF